MQNAPDLGMFDNQQRSEGATQTEKRRNNQRCCRKTSWKSVLLMASVLYRFLAVISKGLQGANCEL